MKQILVISFLILFSKSYTQVKLFSGEVHYNNSIKSKIKDVDELGWKRYLTVSDAEIFYINPDFSIIKNDYFTQYINIKEKTSLTNFKEIDTLYTNFTSLNQTDSSIIKANSKLECDEFLAFYTKKVTALDTMYLGYKCNKIVYEGFDYTTTRIVLDSNIYSNGSYVILFEKDSNCFYSREAIAVNIISKNFEKIFFEPKKLPISKYNATSVFQQAEYKSGQSKWIKYLQKNLKSELGSKYLVTPKGKDYVKATVVVQFVIDNFGNVVYAEARNAAFVHPKLAEEAIRVIKNARGWKNAVFNGHPMPSVFKQNISFVVSDK